MILYYTHPPDGQIFKDDYYYLNQGILISNLWKEKILPDYGVITKSPHYGYSVYNALHYYFLDDNMLYPIISNCFFGTALAIVVYYIAAMINVKIAKVSSLLIVFFPNFIFWSAVNLKDTLLAFLFSLAILIYLKSRYQPSLPRFIMLISVLFVAQTIRTYTTYILLILMLFGYIVDMKLKRFYKLIIIIPMMVLSAIFFMPNLSYNFLSHAMFFSLNASSERSIESTALTASLYSYNLLDYARYLPVHVLRFMITPRPWASEVLDFSNPYSALIPGMIFWILMVPYYIYGMWVMIKKYTKTTFVLYSFVSVCIVIYPYIIYAPSPRSRVQFEPIIMIALAIGLSNRKRIRLLAHIFWIAFIAFIHLLESGIYTAVILVVFPSILMISFVAITNKSSLACFAYKIHKKLNPLSRENH